MLLDSIKLLIQIISKPKASIKNIKILSYDRRSMIFLLIVTYLIVFVQSDPPQRLVEMGDGNLLVIILSIVFFFPVLLYLNFKLIILIDFILIRALTRVNLIYKVLEHLLLPIVVIWNIFIAIILTIDNYLSLSLFNVLNVPYIYKSILVYLILFYKLNVSRARSIIVVSLPVVLGVALYFLV